MRKSLKLTILVLAVVAVGVVLASPLPVQWSTPRLGHVWDFGHFFLFGGLTLGFWWLLGRRMFLALAASVALNAAGETSQLFTPRNADVADFLRGLAGSLVAAACVRALRRPLKLRRTAAGLVLVALFSAWPFLEGVPYLTDIYHEYRSFPVLCDFQSPWQTLRWECRGAELVRVEDLDAKSGWAGRLTLYDDGGKAVLFPVMCDWSGYRRVCCELSAGDRAVPVTLLLGTLSGDRVVARETSGRCGPGECRLSMELHPAPGPGEVPPMDLSQVYCLILTAGGSEWPQTLLVRRIYLE